MNPEVRCISVQPAEPWHGLEGLKHMETSIVPGIYDRSLADEDMGVETEPAYDLARELARTEGILGGHSSGAALWACGQVGPPIGHGVIVTVLPDGGDRYLSTGLYRRAARLNLRFATVAPAAEQRIRDRAMVAVPERGMRACSSAGATVRAWSSST